MCFGEKHSWFTFILGTIATLIGLSLVIKNKLPYEWYVVLLYWYSGVTMQLWEALIHHDSVNNNGKNCEILSKCAYYNNIIQPVILLLLIRGKGSKEVLISLGITFIYFVLVILNTKPEKCILYDDNKIDLKWWINSNELTVISYFLCSMVLIYVLFSNKLKFLNLGIFAFTYLFSVLIYNGERAGNIWCYFSSFTPVLLLMFLINK